jgi:hypothetical protein
VQAEPVARWLAEQRSLTAAPVALHEPDLPVVPARGDRPALPAGWSLARVAGLLGVKKLSVAPLVARHGLPAHGQGKARASPAPRWRPSSSSARPDSAPTRQTLTSPRSGRSATSSPTPTASRTAHSTS